jgi:hypothetical protein
MLARKGRADRPVNDGLFVRWELIRNLLGCGALRPGVIDMRKHFMIRCSIKIDVAACLRALALFIYLLT